MQTFIALSGNLVRATIEGIPVVGLTFEVMDSDEPVEIIIVEAEIRAWLQGALDALGEPDDNQAAA